MNQIEFIKQLRAIAVELKPLIDSATTGSLTWNGKEYAKSSDSKVPHPYALAWWFTLNTVADLIECQESPLTAKQIAYFENLLFGGMGSLNDLSFDAHELGSIAGTVNERLNLKKQILFASFKS